MSKSVLSTIVPVYNEAGRLEELFKYLFQTRCPIEREWLVVDDCSTDGSGDILEGLQKTYGFKLIRHQVNLGKGCAIRSAIPAATGDFILIQDADFEYDPTDIPSLLEPLCADRADVVYGSRFKQNGTQVHRTYHYMVNRFLTTLSNWMSGMYLTDMETCYKVFRADLLKAMDLKSERFGIEIELTANVSKTAARVFELPIHYFPRTYLQGKKIGWKDGVAALFHLVRFNFFNPIEKAYRELPPRYGRLLPQTRRPALSN